MVSIMCGARVQRGRSWLRVRHGGRYPHSRGSEFNNLTQNVHFRNHATLLTDTQTDREGEEGGSVRSQDEKVGFIGRQSET